jgi:hypothetical protein
MCDAGVFAIVSRYRNMNPRPLYPPNQTLVERVGMSALCQERT